ncbi:MAG: tetratricopeptide repeat protein [Saprospirales bacterium]|nr:tetratricopeptide repeat protein [Saprospirales bacterium]
MATLHSDQYSFEPDMDIIRQQCDQVVRGDASTRNRIEAALRNLEVIKRHMADGDGDKAFDKIRETMQDIMDLEVDELKASCSFYMGFLMLTVSRDNAEMTQKSLEVIHWALQLTRNPMLALATYNKLMIHHLNHQNYEMVIKLVDATHEVASGLPRSNVIAYYRAAANYNKAEAFFRQNQFPEVLSPGKDAMDGFREISMETESAKCKGLVGFAMIATGDKTRGLEYTEESLRHFQRLKNEKEVAFLLQGRGMVMLMNGDKQEAIQNLREAVNIFRRSGDINAVNNTLAFLSNVE